MNRKKIASTLSYLGLGLGHFALGHWVQGLIFFVLEAAYLFYIPAFAKGLWGIATLGEKVHEVNGFNIIQGDHSIFLLVDGVFTLILLGLFILVYIINIRSVRKILAEETQPPSPGAFFSSLYQKHFAALILVPTGLLFLIFVLVPIIVTALIAFTNYAAPGHIPPRSLVDWVGLDVFVEFFSMSLWGSTFIRVGVWTFIWALCATFTCYAGGLALALLLSRKDIVCKKFWRTIFILPWAIPGFVSLLIFRLLFSGVGPLNALIESLLGQKIQFWSDPLIAKCTVILINMWLGVPYFMVMISGALTNIPLDIYEAADIDGATAFQKFRVITLPMLLLQTAPILILTFAMNFNNFNAIFLLTDGGPVDSTLQYAGHTDLLITWLYKLTLQQNKYNIASVISLFLFIFLVSISFWQLSRTKAFKEEN